MDNPVDGSATAEHPLVGGAHFAFSTPHSDRGAENVFRLTKGSVILESVGTFWQAMVAIVLHTDIADLELNRDQCLSQISRWKCSLEVYSMYGLKIDFPLLAWYNHIWEKDPGNQANHKTKWRNTPIISVFGRMLWILIKKRCCEYNGGFIYRPARTAEIMDRLPTVAVPCTRTKNSVNLIALPEGVERHHVDSAWRFCILHPLWRRRCRLASQRVAESVI